MSQPTQPTTQEEEAAQIAAAIEASKAAAVAYEEFAEVLGILGDEEIKENEAAFARACEESKREHDELMLALSLSQMDLKDETESNFEFFRPRDDAARTAHDDAARQLDGYVEILYNEFHDIDAAEVLAREIGELAAQNMRPDDIIVALRVREFIDDQRTKKAIAGLAENVYDVNDVVDVLLGAMPTSRPRRRGLDIE